MLILLILCYNGSLVTWTVVSSTAAKCKPLIFSMSGFALSYKVKIKVMLRPAVSRQVRLGVKHPFLLLSDICGFVYVGRLLWWEDGSVAYNCCWPSPTQSFSGPILMGHKVIVFRKKSILTGDLNAESPIWNGHILNPLCLKLLDFFVRFNWKISAPKCPIQYISDGRGDVPDIVVHQIVQSWYSRFR
jgi:hypothetical protein